MIYQGFDEFMNLVLDSAEEVYRKKQTRRSIGSCQFAKRFYTIFTLLHVYVVLTCINAVCCVML